ncbi:MAG TPA: aminotransferase class V-fold PLP-dependent enzyme [Gemmataceae bacterium]|nr:aminotransferase class V-fold PLP-dependent enzyme [Gemmataceae bacterium]
MSDFRDQFPVTKKWAFLDHAAVAPLSGPAQQALVEWAADMAANGDVFLERWIHRIEQVRASAARLLGANLKEVAFIKNTSEGICFVAEGFPWKPGDNVVTAAEEYPANLYPWMNLSGRGVEVRLVPSRGCRIDLGDVFAAVDERTRLISLSHVEYASGFRNDLEAIGSFCRQRGIYFLVDAIQGLGVLPLDVSKLPIDFLAADGHKWLLGPEGAGLFFIRSELVEFLHPISVGWKSVVNATDFSKTDFRLRPHAGRWESGTLNVGGIVSLGASIDLLLEAGIAEVTGRVLHLTDYLCEQLARANLTVASSRLDRERSGIVSIECPPAALSNCVRSCREEGIIINQRANRLRASPHFYNSEEDIDRLVLRLHDVLANTH